MILLIENSMKLFLFLSAIGILCFSYVGYFIIKGLSNAKKNNEVFYSEAQVLIMDGLKFTVTDDALNYYLRQRFDRGRKCVTLRVYTCDINGKKCDYVGEGWDYFKGLYGNKTNESKTI